IQYDEHGNGMINLIGVVPPPGVASYDPYTGEPLDEHGDPVEGVSNPFRLPDYDTETGLPITYDDNNVPHVPNIPVHHPDGVHGYDPVTGEPLDEHGNPVEGAVNPHQRPEDRVEPEHEGLPNFDPQTGLPLEYDEHGNPYPAVDPDDTPLLPEGVAGYDPHTGEPVDEHGKPVEGAENPYGEHTFTTRLEDRDGVDPAGHVVAQRPMYDEDTGLPVYYNDDGKPYVFNVHPEKPDGVYTYDEDTGEPLDQHGNPVEGAENPYQRPNYDTSTGRPVQYDSNGYQVPQPPVYLPPQEGVASYDPKTGEPRDEEGNPVEGATNPWLLDENDVFYPQPFLPIHVTLPDENDLPTLVDPAEELGDTLPTEPLDPGPFVPEGEILVDPGAPDELGELGEPGDIFGKAEGRVETTAPTTEPDGTPEAEKGEVTVPEQRETDDADPFAHAEKPRETAETTAKDAEDDTELRDESVSHEPSSAEPAAEASASHESSSLDAPDGGSGAADTADPVAAG
ncbi:MAG: hypothetical protein M3235_08670, partial [Actinomycetota bacterium]|nr:hypothetical protein [Actinomycetota bacterium]